MEVKTKKIGGVSTPLDEQGNPTTWEAIRQQVGEHVTLRIVALDPPEPELPTEEES